MKYFLTIGGRNYDFLRMKFERIATIESKTADILVLPATGSQRPVFDESVVITKEIDNTKLIKWQGKVKQIQDVPLPNNVIKIIAYDLKHKINFLNVLNEGYSAVKGSTIFNTELEPSKTGLTLGTVDTSDPIIDTTSFGKKIISTSQSSKVTKSSAFEVIQIIGDKDIYVQRDGTTSFEDAGNSTLYLTHVLEHGLNGVLMPDIGYSEDEIRRVKQVIVKGVGIGSNFRNGVEGTPLSTDQIKEIELPFIASNDTADLAADTIYNELNKVNKYAKFMLAPDMFKTNYDVFDTIKLKARLSNKTVDENLKIFSITTTVSAGDEMHEIVELELQNFERAQLAKMLNPIESSSNSLANIRTGVQFTQVNDNVLPVTFGDHASVFIEETVTTSPTSIATVGPFSAQRTSGAYFHFGVRCVIRTNSGGVTDIVIRFYVSDGTTNYPIDFAIDHRIGKGVGDLLDLQLTFFIPIDVAGKTLTLKAESNASVDVTGSAYAYSLGL